MKPELGKRYEVRRCEGECVCATQLEGTSQPPCGVEVLVTGVKTEFLEFSSVTEVRVTFGHVEDGLVAWMDAKFLREL